MAKILFISGSLRQESLNTKLLKICASITEKLGYTCESVSAQDLNVPLINPDIEKTNFPESIKKIAKLVQDSDAIIFATPEYNGGISPVLKNFVDWTSRLQPHPWSKKNIFFTATSPGQFGAVQGMQHSRVPFDKLGAFVCPQSFALPYGDKEIDGIQLKDEKKQKILIELLGNFLSFATGAK